MLTEICDKAKETKTGVGVRKIIVLTLLIMILLTGCDFLPWEKQDPIYLVMPFEASGNSKKVDVATVVYNENREAELLFDVSQLKSDGIYLLTIDDEEYGVVHLKEDPRIVLSPSYFEKDGPVEFRFYSTEETDEEPELRRLLKIQARVGYAVDDAPTDDPFEVAKRFLELSYSTNSALMPSQLLSEQAVEFAKALHWRQRTIALRREAMGNEKELTSFEAVISTVEASEDLAFVFIKSREEFIYLDEPKLPGAIGFRYFSVLIKEDGDWKVLWTTRHGEGDLLDKSEGYLSYFHIPFAAHQEETAFQLDPHRYRAEDLIALFNDREYKDFSKEYEWEVRNIERELEEEVEGLPAAGDDLLPINRQAMLDYVKNYALDRNEEWPDFTFYGGNCQFFASQTLMAGEIPMTDSGEFAWYYHGKGDRSRSWSAVLPMQNILEQNTGPGLSAVRLHSRKDLQEGDLVYIDWDMDEEVDHVMIVTVKGDQPRIAGNTEDAYNKRLTDYAGGKYYYHLEGYRQ